MITSDSDALAVAALGGRAVHSDFLAPEDSSQLVARLRQVDAIGVSPHGGFPGAERRRVSVFPSHIPEASPRFVGVFLSGLDPDQVARWLAAQRIRAGYVGDLIEHQDGVTVIATHPLPSGFEAKAPDDLDPLEVPVERAVSGFRSEATVIVPSLRVDALGAKAFKVSRTYFAKGVAAGNVLLNGVRATKGSSAAAGDELFARGLGWLEVQRTAGETRRGRHKVEVVVLRRR